MTFDFMSYEKLLVMSSRDGSDILLCSDSGARDIADSGTKRQLIRGCVLLIFTKKKSAVANLRFILTLIGFFWVPVRLLLG